MILFGLAEVATGFTHNFFGITTTAAAITTYVSVAIGLFYVLAGLLTLTMRKKELHAAIVLLAGDVLGRAGMVVAGFYPLSNFQQTFSIIAGTAIAVVFAIYLWYKRSEFN
jgi:hypothetical protein